VNTPTLRPKFDRDRIVLIPDAQEPRPRALMALLAVGLVAAMALGGGIVYAWQQGVLHDRDQVVQTARVDAQSARIEADGAFAAADRLRSDITALEAQLQQQRSAGDIAQGRIADVQARAARTQARLDELRDDLAAVTGPPLTNGRHIAYLLEAGTSQSPPMMVIDVGRWYTGERARRAAIADGALIAGEHLFHRRYLRNTGTDWRIVEVATGALFSIRHYGGATTPTKVSFTTLATLLDGGTAGAERIAHNPFWVQVKHHHVITSGHEQRYRAP
jgi:hypothetical protein